MIRPSVKPRCSAMECGSESHPAACSLGTTYWRQVSASVGLLVMGWVAGSIVASGWRRPLPFRVPCCGAPQVRSPGMGLLPPHRRLLDHWMALGSKATESLGKRESRWSADDARKGPSGVSDSASSSMTVYILSAGDRAALRWLRELKLVYRGGPRRPSKRCLPWAISEGDKDERAGDWAGVGKGKRARAARGRSQRLAGRRL